MNIQKNVKKDKKFWAEIGPVLTSKEFVASTKEASIVTDEQAWTLCYDDDNVLLGFAAATSVVGKKKRVLNYIYVAPEHRNSGVFKKLVKEFMDDAKAEAGIEKMVLIATTDSKPLFEKLGFVTVKEYVKVFHMEMAL